MVAVELSDSTGNVASCQTETERAAWLPPERLAPDEWTERNRVLPSSMSAEPGKFSWKRTPYWREPVNSAANPDIRQVVCVKAVQVGWSEFLRSVLGWAIDQEPGPALFVMPSQDSARELMEERIRPMIESSAVIESQLSPDPDDFTKSSARFNSMQVFTAWSGSPQSLASRPVRYVFADEVDKYPPFSGREADPISLGIERTATYGFRAKVFIGSTPTLRTGNVWRAFEQCDDQKCYFIPCPHCRHYQRLVLSGLKFPESTLEKSRRAAQVELAESAYYECEACHGQILERHKMTFLNAGVWVSGRLGADGQWTPVQKVNTDGELIGETPKAKRVGYWINALYSPWKSLSAVAAEFIRSQGDLGKMMNFKNSWMAEPFEEQVGAVLTSEITAMKNGAPKPLIVPEWAHVLIATADVQAEGNLCYYVIRAWGADYKSQLVDFGTTRGVEALDEILDRNYQVGDTGEFPPATIDLFLIDARYVPERVYKWAATDARIRPIIGSNQINMSPFIRESVGSRELGIMKSEINTHYYKNVHEIRRQSDPPMWLVNSAITDEYCRHLSAEHKIRDHKTNAIVWVPRSSGLPNHLFDCEVYQHAGADMAGVNMIVEPQETNPLAVPGNAHGAALHAIAMAVEAGGDARIL